MRTFTEYINEAKQNYIFGGTDGRNTEIKGKTFGELEKGDSFYWVSSFSDYPKRRKVERIEVVKGNTKIYYYDDDGGRGNCKMVGNILDKTCFVFKDSYGIWVTATDEEEFIKAVNSTELNKITSEDIKPAENMHESRQNYIFGGTDNRVPKISSTPIDELSEGDKIYYWSHIDGHEAYECKVIKGEEMDDEFVIDVIMDGKENSLFVYKKFYERGSDVCVCKHDRVLAVFATDEETFLDACNENGIKINNIVR